MRDIDAILIGTHSHVRSYIAALGVPACDVDDIAQDVYLAFARDPDRAPSDVEPLRWLKGIARNLANNYFRRRAGRGQALLRLADVLDSAPAWPVEADEQVQVRALDRCLGALSREHRELIRRYYGADEQAGALAAAFSRSVDGIRRLMGKLRRDLRECVERRLAEER